MIELFTHTALGSEFALCQIFCVILIDFSSMETFCIKMLNEEMSFQDFIKMLKKGRSFQGFIKSTPTHSNCVKSFVKF